MQESVREHRISDDESSSSYSTAEEDHFYEGKTSPLSHDLRPTHRNDPFGNETDLMEIKYAKPQNAYLRPSKSFSLTMNSPTPASEPEAGSAPNTNIIKKTLQPTLSLQDPAAGLSSIPTTINPLNPGSSKSNEEMKHPSQVGLDTKQVISSGQTLTADHLQQIFNCFKVNELEAYDCVSY